jgi:hypothetical protein
MPMLSNKISKYSEIPEAFGRKGSLYNKPMSLIAFILVG